MLTIFTSRQFGWVIYIAAGVAFINFILDSNPATGANVLGWVVASFLRYGFELRTEQLEEAIAALEDAGFEVVIGDGNSE